MRLALIGLIVLAGSMSLLIYYRTREGSTLPAPAVPLLEMLVPLLVTSGVALGLALLIAGVLL